MLKHLRRERGLTPTAQSGRVAAIPLEEASPGVALDGPYQISWRAGGRRITGADSYTLVNLTGELIECERRLEEMIGANAFPSGAASLLEALHATSRNQRAALERQRERIAAEAPSGQVPSSARWLGEVYGALAEVAFAYAVLHARAHRAYDSQVEGNTADLAESHLRAYTAALQQLDMLISDIVVNELGSMGEDCVCRCPACGVGLCLCAPRPSLAARSA